MRRFEKGFLVSVATDASMVGRRDWDAAILAPHWSTIQRVQIDLSSTPKWWLSAWSKGAALPSLRELSFCQYRKTKIVCARAGADAPWRVTEMNAVPEPYIKDFVRWASALPPAERARIEVGAVRQREEILAAIEDANAAP